ncbi:MAG: hypothetical protein PHW79_00175 [Candidatus Marinimicrobia bacterium]|nr:hypothetical protein [Candidatus Neomarinimicrobiota bacterium]
MPSPQIEDDHLDLNGGWIRLYRKAMYSDVFQNSDLWKVWSYCLLKACHSAQTVSVKTGRGETLVNLKSGEFIFGRNAASKELKLPASTVRNKIAKLKSMRNIDIKQDNHFSIISITRWKEYQPENWTGKGQAKDRQTQNLGQANGQAISDEKPDNQDRQQNRQKKEHPQKVDTYNNTRSIYKKEDDFIKSLVSLFSEIESSFTTEDLKYKQEFLAYWTEKNQNGKKERWQMQKVFDVKRRFRTWLQNHNNWNHSPSKPTIDLSRIYSASEVNQVKQSEPSAEFRFTGQTDQFLRLK